MKELLLKLCRREDLTRDEAQSAFEEIVSGTAHEAQVGGLLVGLAAKGSTVDELVGAATVIRDRAIPIPLPPGFEDAVDTCGTGGDVRGTFNISTTAAIIAAGAGAKVVKHGNRSATGRSGSADVLEHLGLKLELEPDQLNSCLRQCGICFAFARSHHPAMKNVAAARSALGIPTIFNLLGPLTNPAGAERQLIGVFAPELTDRLAAVLRELGSRRAWIVHANDGLDEISTLGPTRISELRDGHVRTSTFDPRSLGIEYARLSDLQTDSVADSARAIDAILRGEPGPRRDVAALNAAAALVVAGVAGDLGRGFELACQAIDNGLAMRTLSSLIHASRDGAA